MYYSKPALTFADQVTLLQARGLRIDDLDDAEEFLGHVSYYRLSAYFPPFRRALSESFDSATFDDVTHMYQFDKRWRMLVANALESIEVHFRTQVTQVTYHLSHRGGPFAYIDPIYFVPTFDHDRFLHQLDELEQRSSDGFVRHFRTKYRQERWLPIWMASELLSFGFLSKMFASLTSDLQKEIAQSVGVHQSVLKTWLHTLSYVRNICAHHGRLWNREIAIRPRLPHPSVRWPYSSLDPNSFYAVLLIVCDLVTRITGATECRDAFRAQLQAADRRQLSGMRAPQNWYSLEPWT